MPRYPKKNPRPGIDEYGRTPLWNFALSGDVINVEHELNTGADPNLGDDAGYTPLHVAVQEKNIEVVKLLLEKGADPTQADKHGNTPLWTAVHHWERTNQIILLLLHNGADPRIKNNYGNDSFGIISAMEGEVAEFVAHHFGTNN